MLSSKHLFCTKNQNQTNVFKRSLHLTASRTNKPSLWPSQCWARFPDRIEIRKCWFCCGGENSVWRRHRNWNSRTLVGGDEPSQLPIGDISCKGAFESNSSNVGLPLPQLANQKPCFARTRFSRLVLAASVCFEVSFGWWIMNVCCDWLE